MTNYGTFFSPRRLSSAGILVALPATGELPVRALILLVLAFVAVGVVRCGRESEPAAGVMETLPAISIDLSKALKDAQGHCHISQAYNYGGKKAAKPERVLWTRGGNWEDLKTLSLFAKYAQGGTAAIILNAAPSAGAEDINYYLDYYKKRMLGTTLEPIYALGSDADRDEHVQTIKRAKAIVITGGYPDHLRALPKSELGKAIKAAYERGIPVYTNSASVSLVGKYFGWDLKRRHTVGLELLTPTFMSHMERPGKTEELWRIVPKAGAQAFGLTADTLAVINDKELVVYGDDPAKHRVFVYDQRFPRSEVCPFWVLLPGEAFPVN